MKGLVSILLAAGSAAALVGMASAQPSGGGPRAVLFDEPNFQGRSIVIVEGSPDLGGRGFSTLPMSGRFEGEWTVCDSADLDGRCTSVKGDVANLSQVGLRRIVSLGEAPSDAARSDDDRAGAAFAATDDTAPADHADRPDTQVRVDAGDELVPGAGAGRQARPFAAATAPPPPVAAAPVNAPAQQASAIVASPPAPPPAAVAPVAAAVAPPPPATAAAAPPLSVIAAAAPPPALAPAAAPSASVAVAAEPLPPAARAAAAPSGASKRRAARLQLATAQAHAASPSAAAHLDGDAGQSAVFFAKPTKGGAEVEVDVQGPANQFCKDQGLGPAVYFDTDGRVLRDVLCRRP